MRYKIATFPGDGVGPEIIGEGMKVLSAAADCIPGFDIEFNLYEGGAEYHMKEGRPIEEDGPEGMKEADAIYFGAIGLPGAPEGSGEMIIAYPRWVMDQYVNLRPVKLYPGVRTVIKLKPEDVDFYIVRENSEGLYSMIEGEWSGKELYIDDGELTTGFNRVEGKKVVSMGKRIVIEDNLEDTAITLRVITRRACLRISRYAFELAKREERKRVTCIDKSNIMRRSDGLFRDVYDEVAEDYPDIEMDHNYVDAATQWILRNPGSYDVIVCSNEWGDILSDMCSVLAGSMGMMPSGNIGDDSASFEPIAGSAPKYTGMRVVNPIGAILSGEMMLKWLGGELRTPNNRKKEDDKALFAASLVRKGVEEVLREGKVLTYDLGGNSRNDEVGDAIVDKIETSLNA